MEVVCLADTGIVEVVVVLEPVADSMPPIAKAGGWRKCEHPRCENEEKTLYTLTGRKGGWVHIDKQLQHVQPHAQFC